MVEAWNARNKLYQQLIGDYTTVFPDSYAPPRDNKLVRSGRSGTFDTADPAKQDQCLAILTYAPDPLRPHWTYLTSGLSNPWFQDEPQEVSGFGCELMLKTPAQSHWAVQALQSMAFYIFNSMGTLSPGVLVRLNAPVSSPAASDLNSIIVWYADEAPDAWYQLPSGGFGIYVVIGITEDECKFAESVEEYGAWCIQNVLRQTGVGQISDSARRSVMLRDDIDELLKSVKLYADNFRVNLS